MQYDGERDRKRSKRGRRRSEQTRNERNIDTRYAMIGGSSKVITRTTL